MGSLCHRYYDVDACDEQGGMSTAQQVRVTVIFFQPNAMIPPMTCVALFPGVQIK
jgi:hypothetical protein